MRAWIDGETLNMTPFMLGPMQKRLRGDHTNSTAKWTRSVSKVGESSPVLFNMYVDHLVTAPETSEFVRFGEVAVLLVVDGVLLQTSSRTGQNKGSF